MASRNSALVLWTCLLLGGTQMLSLAASSPNRTVVFLFYTSVPGEDVFVRGGLDAATHAGCTDTVQTDQCAIPLRTHLLGTIDHYDKYNTWRVGDNFLDWHGGESSQGSYQGQVALGTPLVWTTNNVLSPGYQQLNTFGDHYWMVDMEMDCSRADLNGWFEVKGFLSSSETDWEPDITQGICDGTLGSGEPSGVTTNHRGVCGAINVFTFGQPHCTINVFPDS